MAERYKPTLNHRRNRQNSQLTVYSPICIRENPYRLPPSSPSVDLTQEHSCRTCLNYCLNYCLCTYLHPMSFLQVIMELHVHVYVCWWQAFGARVFHICISVGMLGDFDTAPFYAGSRYIIIIPYFGHNSSCRFPLSLNLGFCPNFPAHVYSDLDHV